MERESNTYEVMLFHLVGDESAVNHSWNHKARFVEAFRGKANFAIPLNHTNSERVIISEGKIPMSWFYNFKVRTKIITGYVIALSLIAFVGAVAIVQLNDINQTVDDLANNLAYDLRLADQVVEHVLLVRFFANRYIRNQTEDELLEYQRELVDFQELINLSEQEITDPERAVIVTEIIQDAETYQATFEQIRALIDQQQETVDQVLNVSGPEAESLLQQVRDSAFANDNAVASFYAGNIQRAFLLMRFDAFRFLDDGSQEWVTLFAERYQQTQDELSLLDAELQDPTQQALIDQIAIEIDAYAAGFAQIQETYTQENDLIINVLDVVGPKIRTDALAIAESVSQDFDVAVADTNLLVRNTWLVLGITMGLAAVLGLTLGVVISGAIITPLRQVVDAARHVAAGDLSPQLTIQARDELGLLGDSFNQMTESLRLSQENAVGREVIEQAVGEYNLFIEKVSQGDLTARLNPTDAQDTNQDLVTLGYNLNRMVAGLENMTQQIQAITSNISSAAAQILAATTQQAAGANEQSTSITQTTSTISQVKAIVEQTYTKAEEVANQATQTRTISQQGQAAVEETMASMAQIREQVSGIAENILVLSQRTQQIGEITTTVNEIASQSNLLALNASVEAARAGEHGKGFAVVAVEVRNLAEQSRQATAQVRAILNEIQQATNAAVMATEEGTKGVDAGVGLTKQAGETIRQLSHKINESTDTAQQIVASAQQQSTGMEQITYAMENINQATVQGLDSTRQTERSAQDLAAVAQQLETMVAQYKLTSQLH